VGVLVAMVAMEWGQVLVAGALMEATEATYNT
jgi:hypothetical protein